MNSNTFQEGDLVLFAKTGNVQIRYGIGHVDRVEKSGSLAVKLDHVLRAWGNDGHGRADARMLQAIHAGVGAFAQVSANEAAAIRREEVALLTRASESDLQARMSETGEGVRQSRETGGPDGLAAPTVHSGTKLVDVVLSAFTRVEYREVVEVPVGFTDADIEELVEARYESVDGGAYTQDPDYWQRAQCKAHVPSVEHPVPTMMAFRVDGGLHVEPADADVVSKYESDEASPTMGRLWWSADNMEEAIQWRDALTGKGVQVHLQAESSRPIVHALLTLERAKASEILGYDVAENEWLQEDETAQSRPRERG